MVQQRHRRSATRSHLHAAVDRRRPGRADPGAADLDRHRHHRHPRGRPTELEPRPGHRAASCCASPRPLFIAAGVLGGMALVPGPAEDAVHRSSRLILGGRRPSRCATAASARRPACEELAEARGRSASCRPCRAPIRSRRRSALDTLELEIGYGLIPLVDENEGGELLKRVSLVRRQMAAELGLVLQPIRIRDNVQLASHDYASSSRASRSRAASCCRQPARDEPRRRRSDARRRADRRAGLRPAGALDLHGRARARRGRRATRSSTRRRSSSRTSPRSIRAQRRRPARPPGRARAARPPARSATRRWWTSSCPTSARSATSTACCRACSAEGVSIRDLGTVLETMGDRARLTKDPALLTEYCPPGAGAPAHVAPRRTRSARCAVDRARAAASSRSSPTASCRRRTAPTSGSTPAGPRPLVRAVRDTMEHVTAIGRAARRSLCSPKVRRHLRALTAHAVPRLVVLSYNEILPEHDRRDRRRRRAGSKGASREVQELRRQGPGGDRPRRSARSSGPTPSSCQAAPDAVAAASAASSRARGVEVLAADRAPADGAAARGGGRPAATDGAPRRWPSRAPRRPPTAPERRGAAGRDCCAAALNEPAPQVAAALGRPPPPRAGRRGGGRAAGARQELLHERRARRTSAAHAVAAPRPPRARGQREPASRPCREPERGLHIAPLPVPPGARAARVDEAADLLLELKRAGVAPTSRAASSTRSCCTSSRSRPARRCASWRATASPPRIRTAAGLDAGRRAAPHRASSARPASARRPPCAARRALGRGRPHRRPGHRSRTERRGRTATGRPRRHRRARVRAAAGVRRRRRPGPRRLAGARGRALQRFADRDVVLIDTPGRRHRRRRRRSRPSAAARRR